MDPMLSARPALFFGIIPLNFSAFDFSTKSLSCLLIAVVVIASIGCEQQSADLSNAPKYKNNPQPINYAEVPPSFERVNASLFRKPLDKTAQESGSVMRFQSRTDSGIEFENYLSRSRTNLLIETGSGIALGDFDNDGLVDVYLTGSDVANRLYKNIGGFQFEDVTEAAGVDGRIQDQLVWASGATFADIDNDGDLDLYVCNMAAPNLLYVNQNDGTFVEQSLAAGCAYTGASKQANFCDFDRDGDLDMYLLTYQDLPAPREPMFQERDGVVEVIPGKEEWAGVIDGHKILAGEKDILFQNNGDGTFVDVTQAAGVSGYGLGLSCNWFDFDNDNWQDLYVGSDFKQPDKLYRNNRDGTFTDVLPETVNRTPWFSMGMDSGDLNNDGWLDLMVADMADRTHYGQKVNMGTMGSDAWFLNSGKPRQFMKNCVFINSGVGRFMEAAHLTHLAKTDWTWAIRFVDMDNDGRQDVFVTNGHARDNMNSDLTNRIAAMKQTKGFKEEDLKELYRKVPARKNTNLAYRNKGDFDFESVGEAWGVSHTGVSHAAAFADLDNDGDLDCLVNNYYEPALVYENQSTSGHRVLFQLRCQDNNFFGVGAKIELWYDGEYQRKDLQPSRGYLGCDPMVVHFGLADSTSIERAKITWPDGTTVEHTDLASDNVYRVIETKDRLAESEREEMQTLFVNKTEKTKFKFQHVESNYNDYEKEPLIPFALSKVGGSVAGGDVNGDSLPDFYCGGSAGIAGRLLVSQNDKTFLPVKGPWTKHLRSEDMGALFFDCDGDDDLDLYVASGSNEWTEKSDQYRDRLYLNDGNGGFSASSGDALPEVYQSGSCVCAADFDRDGDLDLFVGSRSVPGKYPLTPKSQLLINEGGKFTLAETEISDDLTEIGLVNSAVWSDFNSDGWIDLVVASEWGPVSFYKNDDGRLMNVSTAMSTAKHLGWWHGIAAADLDRDGDMDYVVTNQGLNTKYHASAKHPHRLYYGDFDNSGSIDLVEAEFEGDTEYPIRGRSCSSRCMPFIADKYKTFHDFSLATVADIYETKSVDRPAREANYFQSAVFWNEGDQGFTIAALPRLAQISPGYGVALDDFDGDGFVDVLMATNFFHAQPETNYMGGGLGWLLRGKGGREFESTWPNRSGIVIEGDANGLAIADYDNDGDQDAIFAVNSGRYELLENRSNTEGSLRLSVVGPPGNKFAIGARVELIGEGYQRCLEVQSGGSYLSQSPVGPIFVSKQELDKVNTVKVMWPDGTETSREMTTREGGNLSFVWQGP